MSRMRMRQQPRATACYGAESRHSRRWPRTQIAAVVVSLLMVLVCSLVLYGPVRAGDTVHPVSFPYDQQVGLLGADALGRDVEQRLMAGGARLLVALPIGAVTTLCITVLSLLAVQRPRWRRVANRLSTSLLAIPAMVVVLAAASIFPAWLAVSAAMLLLGVPQGMRQLSAAAGVLVPRRCGVCAERRVGGCTALTSTSKNKTTTSSSATIAQVGAITAAGFSMTPERFSRIMSAQSAVGAVGPSPRI